MNPVVDSRINIKPNGPPSLDVDRYPIRLRSTGSINFDRTPNRPVHILPQARTLTGLRNLGLHGRSSTIVH